MAGPVLNLTIFTRSTCHALRAVSLATFPPGFLILLLQGIFSGNVNPAIGIIPLFASSAYSALLLANEKKCGCQASGLTGTPIHLMFDLLLGIGLLVCLILDWIFMPQGYGNLPMLGTYGTNFLICNFFIHFYFVTNTVLEALRPGASYPTSCPQCQDSSFSFGKIKLDAKSFHGYEPLLDGQGGPNNISGDTPAAEGASAV